MADRVHLGHIFHLTGSPKITDADAALVAIPDGALGRCRRRHHRLLRRTRRPARRVRLGRGA